MESKSDVWVEELRPKTLADVQGQKPITDRLIAYAKKGSIPHLCFSGPAGTGKTSAVYALAKAVFGDDWKNNFKELNASDDRGIDVVRNEIKDYASYDTYGDADFKILFLDEADALTPDAQDALRRTMETCSKTTRFIISCNYLHKLKKPIRDRMACFRFKPVSPEVIAPILEKIAINENITINNEAIEKIAEYSDGSVRKSFILIEQCSIGVESTGVTEVEEIVGKGEKDWVKRMMELCIKNNLREAERVLFEQYHTNGLVGEEILDTIYDAVRDSQLPDDAKFTLFDFIGQAHWVIVMGGSDILQLRIFLTRFTNWARKAT